MYRIELVAPRCDGPFVCPVERQLPSQSWPQSLLTVRITHPASFRPPQFAIFIFQLSIFNSSLPRDTHSCTRYSVANARQFARLLHRSPAGELSLAHPSPSIAEVSRCPASKAIRPR